MKTLSGRFLQSSLNDMASATLFEKVCGIRRLLLVCLVTMLPVANVDALDLGKQLSAQLDEKPVYDPASKEFVWAGMLRNITHQAVNAPVALVVDSLLPADTTITLQQSDGLVPEGSAYRVILKQGAIEADSEVRFFVHFAFANPVSALAGEALEKVVFKALKSPQLAQSNFQFNYHLAKIPAGNQRPIANASISQSGPVGSEFSFDGSTSSDADQHGLSYVWKITGRPNGSIAQLQNFTTAKPSIFPDIPGEYRVSLVVNDGYFDSAPDEVSIYVETDGTVNRSPIISSSAAGSGTATREYSYPVIAGDADGDQLTYTLSKAPVGMSITAGGVIQWKVANSPHEHIPVEVEVSDGRGGIAVQKFSIHIMPCTCI